MYSSKYINLTETQEAIELPNHNNVPHKLIIRGQKIGTQHCVAQEVEQVV